MFFKRSNRLGMVYIAPALLFMILAFLAPLLMVLAQSLFTMDGDASLDAYKHLTTTALFLRITWNTIEISSITVILTLFLSYPVALHLANQPIRRRAFLIVLVLLPFWTSILVKSFAFLVLLGRDGVINQGVRILFGDEVSLPLLFNRTGVIIGMTHFFIPFMVFPILNSLLAQDAGLLKAARIMGAGPIRTFLRVTLPLSMPGVLAGCLITFVMSLGFFVTPALLGGRTEMMIANLIDFYARETLNWPVASALAVVLLLLSLGFIGLLSRLPGGRGVLGGTH